MILYASNKFYGVELYPADICSPIIPSMHDFHPLPHKGVQYTRFVRGTELSSLAS
jgi:hypothetical protein